MKINLPKRSPFPGLFQTRRVIKTSTPGQALVFIALFIPALIAVSALTINVLYITSTRDQVRNTTDSFAITGSNRLAGELANQLALALENQFKDELARQIDLKRKSDLLNPNPPPDPTLNLSINPDQINLVINQTIRQNVFGEITAQTAKYGLSPSITLNNWNLEVGVKQNLTLFFIYNNFQLDVSSNVRVAKINFQEGPTNYICFKPTPAFSSADPAPPQSAAGRNCQLQVPPPYSQIIKVVSLRKAREGWCVPC